MFYIYTFRDEFVTGRIFHVKTGPFVRHTHRLHTAVGLVIVESHDNYECALFLLLTSDIWHLITALHRYCSFLFFRETHNASHIYKTQSPRPVTGRRHFSFLFLFANLTPNGFRSIRNPISRRRYHIRLRASGHFVQSNTNVHRPNATQFNNAQINIQMGYVPTGASHDRLRAYIHT